MLPKKTNLRKRLGSLLLCLCILLSCLPVSVFAQTDAAHNDHHLHNDHSMLQSQDCDHDWSSYGYCLNCGEDCSHDWVDGYCMICYMQCDHLWSDGRCGLCGYLCTYHEWNYYADGYTLCRLCGMECLHSWSDGHCSLCERTCEHSFDNGICYICGLECIYHHWKDGVCAVCDRECNHIWKNGTCTVCEMSKGCEHNWKNSVCTICGVTCTHSWREGTCTVCGKKCTAHSWKDGTCTVCGKKCVHSWKNSVCTTCGKQCTAHSWREGTCTVCGKQCTTHSWEKGTCTICGKKCTNHSWENSICTICGKQCTTHSWSNGACSNCGKACTHSWNNGEVTTAPTETAMGVKTFTCTICGATRTESLDAKGHSYQNGICSDCGSYQEADLVTWANRKSLGLSANFVGYHAIGNAGQLLWFRDKVSKSATNGSDRSMKVILTADISLKDVDYTPATGRYRGTFDGNGHTISDMVLTSEKAESYVQSSYPHYEYLGLFCRLYNATVQNLTIKGSITLTDGTYYSGAVAGQAQQSTIRNVDSYITITNTTTSKYIQYPSGIVGSMYGDGSKIQNCRFYGSITLDYAYSAAGIVGSVSDLTTVSDCTNYGGIDIKDGSYAAGIASHARSGAIIERCLNVGSVELDTYCAAAGILADGYYSFTVRDCGNIGTIIARPNGSLAYVSGIVAIAGPDNDAPSSVTGCYNIGTVKDETNPSSKLMGVIVGSISKGSDYSSGLSDETVYGNYYLQGTTPFYLNSTAVTSAAGTAITSSQVTSGELAYRLNGSRNAGLWKQTLGTDKYPSFTGENVCYSSRYYNTHNYVNGSCSGCGALCTHKWSSGACTVCGLVCAHLNCEGGYCKTCGYYQPAEPDEKGYYEIANAGQAYWFAAKVNAGDNKLNAKLLADIDVTAKSDFTIGTQTYPYGGVFDGNGHTLKVNISSTTEAAAPFSYAGGATFKSLTVSGTITTSAKYAGGFVGSTKGTITFEKCLSLVTIQSTVNGDGTHGGFIGVVNASGTVTVTSCGFAGAINGNSTSCCGGIAGWLNASMKVTDSFVAASYTISTDSCNTIARNDSNLTLDNVYYLNALGGVPQGAVSLTQDQLTSGELAWLLNDSTSTGVWKQTLGTDKYPNFSGGTVYPSEYTCPGKVIAFNNSKAAGTIPAHQFENNTCTVCGLVCKHESYENGFCKTCDGYQAATLNADGYYEIASAGQLYWFAAKVNGGDTTINGKLTANITDNPGTFDASGAYVPKDGEEARIWTPIGNYAASVAAYRGSFDGNGKTISGLYYSGSDPYVGLFGRVSNDSAAVPVTIKNLSIANSAFNSSTTTMSPDIGGLVGMITLSSNKTVMITGCYTDVRLTATATAASIHIGGLVGDSVADSENEVIVTNCRNAGAISANITTTGNIYAGGLIGSSDSGIALSNCCNTGSVTGSGKNVSTGGVVGRLRGTAENCYNTGSVTGSGEYTEYLGGVAGDIGDEAAAGNCYYLTGTASAGVGDGTDTTTAKTSDELASGAVAWLLNGEKADGVWKQTLTGDKKMSVPGFTGETVYYGYDTCAENAVQVYANEQLAAEKPVHSWENSTCTVCGKQCTVHSWQDGICTICGKVCKHESYENSICTECGEACRHESYDNGFCKACDIYEQPEGSGTADDPYRIQNAGQLYWFAAKVNSGERSAHAKLTDNIIVNPGTFDENGTYTPKNDEAPRVWTQIGGYSGYGGTFDGNRKTISGLYLYTGEYATVGMFGEVEGGATLKNIGILGSFFYGDHNTGALIGRVHGSIQITGCYSNSIIRGNHYVGGLIGRVIGSGSSSIIENCYTSGLAKATSSYAGGLIGEVSNVTVRNCYSTASVWDGTGKRGVLCGSIDSEKPTTVTNCYFLPATDKNSAQSGVGIGTGDVNKKSKEQFASGEVAWLLNGKKADGVWKQTLGENGAALPSFAGETVYFGYNLCEGEYSNQPLPYDKPNHSWEDSTCTVCGKQCTVHSWQDGVCTVCSKHCGHDWFNGVCTICSVSCAHTSWTKDEWGGDFDRCDNCGVCRIKYSTCDEDGGNRRIEEAYADEVEPDWIYNSTLKLKEGWYLIQKSVMITENTYAPFAYDIEIEGDVHLIIANQSQLRVEGSIYDKTGQSCLHIYSQRDNNGNISLPDVMIHPYPQNTAVSVNLTVYSGCVCIQGSNQDSGYTPAGVAVDSSCTLTVNGGEVWVTNDSNFDDPIAESPLASQPILNGGTLYLTSPSANGVCAYKPVTRDGCRWKVSVSTEAYSPLDYDPSYMTSLTDEEYNKLTDLSGYKTVCLEPLPAISSVGTRDAMATAKVTITEPGDYTLVFADYENGRLNGLNTVAFTVPAGLTGNRTITSTAAITLGTGDRVMLWKSLSGMKPICEAHTVK